MDIATECTVRVDRLSDNNYIVTERLPYDLDCESVACKTEGQMVAAVLKAVMPSSSVAGSDLIQSVAAVAGVSLDKMIEDQRKQDGIE